MENLQSKEMKIGNVEIPERHSGKEIFQSLRKAYQRDKTRKRVIALLSIVLVIVVVAWGVVSMSGEDREAMASEAEAEKAGKKVTELKVENKELKNRVEELKSQVSDLNSRISAMKSSQENATGKTEDGGKPSVSTGEKDYIVHEVKEGEFLWMLAKKYYGDGYAYHRIIKDNNIEHPDVIPKGKKLKIYKEQ